MEQDTTYVAFDDRKRELVAAILRPGAPDPEEREFPKDPHLIRRFFRRPDARTDPARDRRRPQLPSRVNARQRPVPFHG